MRSVRHLLLLFALGLGLGAAIAVASPSAVEAQKLPVDCSGRNATCTTVRNCTEWHDHDCYQYTTDYWYWYYTTQPTN